MSDFLYPFLEDEGGDRDTLLADLAASAGAKGAESARLSAETLARNDGVLAALATAMAERFGAGGRLFVFGNGGSSTDAAGIADLFCTPPWGRPLHARSLASDRAVVTALGNDVGYDLVFSRQVIAHGRAGDIAMGVSTSGNSTNLLTAFGEGRRRRLLTAGLAGYDGGQMAASPDVEYCVVVPSSSVHRIQEAQAAVVMNLWTRIQALLDKDVDRSLAP